MDIHRKSAGRLTHINLRNVTLVTSLGSRLGLICLGVLVALVFAEVVLRVLGISYPKFYDYDPHLGAKLRPGTSGYWLEEGGGYVEINSDGLRDREHSVTKPRNTLRIAVLGDSYCEAMQVDRRETFWAIMESMLQQCLQPQKLEVINFGQAGFGTTQELLSLRHKAWKYSPDIVLLAFTTGNDIADNSRALKKRDYHPYHVYKGDKLVLDDHRTKQMYAEEHKRGSWWRHFHVWRLDRIRVEQLWRHVKKVVSEQSSAKAARSSASSVNQGSEIGLSGSVYREPTDEVCKEAWRVTEGVLRMMRDEVRSKGAQFFVLILSSGIQVHPDRSIRVDYARRLGVNDLFYPDRRVVDFCEREGVAALALAPLLQQYAETNRVFLHGFEPKLGSGHWNQNGHRLAGEIASQWLCDQLK